MLIKMFRLKNETKILTNFISRQFVTKSKNLYDILGITPHATQADIKTAYYKLSKAYHPDRNTDELSGEKFRAITGAYEVLGNYRLRKLYDKGIIHTAGRDYAQHSKPAQRTQPYEESETDDPTTIFYRSRLKREHTGKTKIYDFDEWTNNHYGETFKQQQETKKRQNFKNHRDLRHTEKLASRNTIFVLLGMVSCFVIIAEFLVSSSHLDNVSPSKQDDSGKNQ